MKKKKDKKTELIEAIEARQPNPKDVEAALKSFFDDVVYAPPSSQPSGKETKETPSTSDPAISLQTQKKLDISTAVITAVDSEVEELEKSDSEAQNLLLSGKKQRLRPGKEREFVTLDSTHTKSEALVYSLMYRETISKGRQEAYFSLRKLAKMTGIGSDKTVFNALRGLREKLSIVLVEHSNNSPIGTLYRVLSPKEIMEERKKRGIEINLLTKKILSTAVAAVDSEVATAVKTTAVGAVKSTAATAVKTTAEEGDTPYINKYNINRDDSLKNKESSSKSSSNKDDDTDDDIFSHRVYIISLYEKYTDNHWRVGDDEFYKSEDLKSVLPEVIEAAIIASVLRSKTKMNSFAYCKGTIEEFQENLPPGYLSHLRKEWRKAKSEEVDKKEDAETQTTPFLLSLPRDSYFEEGWLKNYISGFPKEEQARIKSLAERFDHFMITAGEKKEWIKNPTGTFIGLVRGEINVLIAKQAPSFEERVAEEERIKEEEKIREQERLEWERVREEQEQRKGEIEKEIREAISQLSDENLRKFMVGARKKYGVKALESDESVLERIPYLIMYELFEKGEEDWRRIWDSIYKADQLSVT